MWFYVILALWVCFFLYLSLYSIFFGPLSSFPGPRLAALTKLYEAYHVLVKNDWYENLEELHRKHGPVVRIGPNELHFTDHVFCLEHHKRPDLLKCDNYYGLLNKLLGGFALPILHSKRASVLRPLFSGPTLAGYSNTSMDNYIEELYTRLSTVITEGGDEVNLTHYLWAYTNDVMVSYLTGEDHGFLKERDLVAVHDRTRAFSAIDLATVLRCMPPIKSMFDVFPTLRRLSPLGWLDELVSNRLGQITTTDPSYAEKGRNENTLILSRMLGRLDDQSIVTHEAAQAIFIGNESLLSNMTFLLHHMVQNPECVIRLRAELDTLDLGTYGHRVWHDPRVLRLPYLDSLCRESSRLSSPGWHRQPRQIAECVTYENMTIPPMTSLSFTLRMLERDPLIYRDPESFRPERWMGTTEEAKAARDNSATFGTGTRTCLGQHIARVVLRKTLACLIYNFDLMLWDGQLDKDEGYRYLDTYPKKGHEGYFRVRLEPRFSGY